MELPENVRERLEEPNFWHLATVNPDGSPQSTTVWVDVRDGKILVNTALGPQEAAEPRARAARGALVARTRTTAATTSHGIQGRVVDSYTGDQAEADIDSLAQKYIGQSPYPWRSPASSGSASWSSRRTSSAMGR